MALCEIRVSGMHCGSCVKRLKKALDSLANVKVHSVDVGLVEIELFAEDARERVEAAITSAGYSVG